MNWSVSARSCGDSPGSDHERASRRLAHPRSLKAHGMHQRTSPLNGIGLDRGLAEVGGHEHSLYIFDKQIQPQHVIMTANGEVISRS